MTRSTLVAMAVAIGFASLSGVAPAGATDWSWLNNKPYTDCLRVMSINWSHLPPAQNAAANERGRHICNQKYYGHP